MKKKVIIAAVLSISVILNIVFIVQKCTGSVPSDGNVPSENEKSIDVNELASNAVKTLICKNLYIPESYDPVEIKVDSLYYGPLLDSECCQAAITLIDKRKELPGAQDSYEEAEHTLRNFGSSGVFWRNKPERDEAKLRLDNIIEDIAKAEEVIKNRCNSFTKRDFIGWLVYHKYRAKANNGNVSFGEVCYCFDESFENVIAQYSVDKDDPHNLYAIFDVIKEIKEKE